GEALKMTAPQAHAAGMSLAETNGVLGVLANAGIKGSMAGTTMNAMLRDLTGNAEDGVVNFGDFAVGLFDAGTQLRPSGAIVRDIETGTAGMNDQQRESALRSVFQAQSLRGVNVMLAAGVDKYDEITGAIENSGGVAANTAGIMQDTMKGAFDEVGGAVET